MKTIPLTQGKFALVDDEDYDELNKYKWYASKTSWGWYAIRDVWIHQRKSHIRMHTQIFGQKMLDHIDHDGLNNQRSNLRLCSQSQNMANARLYKNNSSGFRGVSWFASLQKWEAHIKHNYKKIRIGLFDDKIEAAKQRDRKAVELFGEFAVLNFPVRE